MSLHCFFVPARASEPAQSELNTFLAAQRVLAVQREWLADGAHSGWALRQWPRAATSKAPHVAR